uniref:Adenosine 3'-phospho 5'-phosphosulfate transporter 1 n=1 Tax=Aceria tosichella TaxID=561515 RepID=A0A6G1S3R1_9ACAR
MVQIVLHNYQHNRSEPEMSSAREIVTSELSTTSTTWVERLFLNLLSYLIVILPVVFIVIATKYKLFPRWLQSNPLIQWFVYGSTDINTPKSTGTNLANGGDEDDAKGLLDKHHKVHRANQSGGRQQQQQSSIRDSALEFIWCLLGLQVSYLIWGLLQERIMTTEYPVNDESGFKLNQRDLNNNKHLTSSSQTTEKYLHDPIRVVKFHDSQFLVFINRLVAFVTAILALVYTRQRRSRIYANRFKAGGDGATKLLHHQTQQGSTKPQAPLYKYIYCSLSNILSSWSQYEALKYVNFPTQCLSKSCKVIPVMLMSRILLRQRHSASDYCCAFLLALGMFIFLIGQPLNHHRNDEHKQHDVITNETNASNSSKESRSQEQAAVHEKLIRNSGLASGLIILSLYLTFDSFTSNWQQSLYTQYDVTNWQMMAAINFYSILLTLTSLHQLGGLRPALQMLASSSRLMRDCLTMSVMSSVGQMFVYYTIKRFGSVLFAVIMTFRQLLSILISIIVFRHEIDFSSTLGLVLVFSVAGYQVYHKSKRGNKRGKGPSNNLARNSNAHSSETVLIEFKK